jgi:ketosteroid isomerase-like protein
MRMIGLCGATIAALFVFAPALSAHEPPRRSTLSSVLPAQARGAAASVDAFHAALRRGNTKAASALLADNALIFEGGGVERSKAEYEAHHLSADAAFSQAVPSVMTRRAGDSDGTVAWIASEGRTTGTYKGKAIDRVTAETMVLRRIGRVWKVTHIHWSSAAKP